MYILYMLYYIYAVFWGGIHTDIPPTFVTTPLDIIQKILS